MSNYDRFWDEGRCGDVCGRCIYYDCILEKCTLLDKNIDDTEDNCEFFEFDPNTSYPYE